MIIEKASFNDLPAILQLQKLAYLSEAKLVNDFTIQPLTQTLQSIEDEFEKGIILKAIDKHSDMLVGSIRAHAKTGTAYIGKLMVHPDFQKKGIGTLLIQAIEACYPGKRLELFTSTLSDRNISMYKKMGYSEFKREMISDGVEMTYLESRSIKKQASI